MTATTELALDIPTYNGRTHPAADIFPMLDLVELVELAADIAEHGLNHPITLLPDGTLLDGRNRLAACERAGLPATFRVFTGDDPIAFVISENVKRRHLNDGQLAFVALDFMPLLAEQAAARQGARTDLLAKVEGDFGAPGHQSSRGPRSADLAAAMVGTSGRAVARAKAIRAGSRPDLEAKVRDGSLLLRPAEMLMKRERVQAEEQAARVVVAAAIPADASGHGWRMFAGDFRDRLAEIPAGSVDLIVTDPPYPSEFLPLWTELAIHAKRVLAPQGIIVALSGKIQMNAVMDRLGDHLDYGWIYAQPLPGSHSRILARKILQGWKPWLAYSNGAWPSGRVDWHVDLLDASTYTKDHYRWEQDSGPARSLIENLCPIGGTILDPFSGTGSYGLLAVAMGREFIGVEKDADRFALSVARLTAAEPT